MLTLFTTPKPFRDKIDTIQRNAIRSWLFLEPKCEIILFGNDEGTSEVAIEYGIRHVPKVSCNEYGTPLIDSLFEIAQDLAKYKLMAYINADIILMNDFVVAVQRIEKSSFLMVGQRHDIEIDAELDFGNPECEYKLRRDVEKDFTLHNQTGIDYFVFNRGLFRGIPPFAIGRTAWDNWLIYRARSLGVPVIDATNVVTAIHQNHDYLHHADGEEGVWKGPESQYNLNLSHTAKAAFSIADATHLLKKEGLKSAFDISHMWRRFYAVLCFYSFLTPMRWTVDVFLKISRPIRAKAKLTIIDAGR